MNISCYFPAIFFLIVVFLILEPLGVDFELPRGPSHLQKSSFYCGKLSFLVQRGFALKDALEGAFGCLLGSFWCILGVTWGFFWCQNGFELAPRISKTAFFTPLSPQEAPKEPPKRSQETNKPPKHPQEPPITPQGLPRRPPSAPKRPQEAPQSSPRAPKGPLSAPSLSSQADTPTLGIPNSPTYAMGS